MIAIISIIISALVSHNVIFYGGLAPFCPKCNGKNTEEKTANGFAPSPAGSSSDKANAGGKYGRFFGAVLAAVMFISIIVCYFMNKLLIRLSAEYLFAFLCGVVPSFLALGADSLLRQLIKRRASVAHDGAKTKDLGGNKTRENKANENKEGKTGKADKVDNAAGLAKGSDEACGEKMWGSVGTILIAAVSVTLVVALKNTSFSAVEIVFAALFSALGYLLALAIMGGIAERMETANIPRFFRGAPVLILAAAIIALAVFAFESFSFSIG